MDLNQSRARLNACVIIYLVFRLVTNYVFLCYYWCLGCHVNLNLFFDFFWLLYLYILFNYLTVWNRFHYLFNGNFLCFGFSIVMTLISMVAMVIIVRSNWYSHRYLFLLLNRLWLWLLWLSNMMSAFHFSQLFLGLIQLLLIPPHSRPYQTDHPFLVLCFFLHFLVLFG